LNHLCQKNRRIKVPGTIVCGLFVWPASGTEQGVKAEAVFHPLNPILAPERLPAVHAAPQRFQFALAFCPVDAF
jgi:hypothetical protein